MARERVAAAPPRTLPRGRHRLDREVVEASQRARLLEAMAVVADEQGYASTSVTEVCSSAGVSRKTFYEHFDDKLDCFLAAYDEAATIVVAEMEAAAAAHSGWREAVWAAVDAYLGTLAGGLALRAFFLEVGAAGDAALARRAVVHERFARTLRQIHGRARTVDPSLPKLPAAAYRAAVGAVNELVTEEIRAGRERKLRRLTPFVVDLLVTLFEGWRRAARH